MGSNRWIAAFLSFWVGGLGHVYLGLWRRALVFFALDIATTVAYSTLNIEVFFLLNILVGALSMTDAYYMAKHAKKEGLEEPEKQPEIRVF